MASPPAAGQQDDKHHVDLAIVSLAIWIKSPKRKLSFRTQKVREFLEAHEVGGGFGGFFDLGDAAGGVVGGSS